jgi:Family of unknown function (DUF6010)
MSAPPIHSPFGYFGPAIGAALFVVGMSRVPEPMRRRLNAILVAGACGAYLNGGFGVWELLYPIIAMPAAYLGLGSYRYIGLAWLMHAAWDLPHHLWGRPIWPFMPTSSFGCMIFDALIAVWFLAGAPVVVPLRSRVAAKVWTAQSSTGPDVSTTDNRESSGTCGTSGFW